MNTPWGTSDSAIKIQRGVSWVGTPSHGGLAVTATVAAHSLSAAARSLGDFKGRPRQERITEKGYYFFEEDCAYAVAFYEHPEWKRVVDQNSLDYWRTQVDNPTTPLTIPTANKLEAEVAKTDEQIRNEMANIIRRWFPEYFRNMQEGI